MVDDSWNEFIKDVVPIKHNKFTDEITLKETKINNKKEKTVCFSALSKGKPVKKDDLTQMDGSLAKRFKRESFRVEAVLDLHGITEKDAHERVIDFIISCYNSGQRCVLIITGKGVESDEIFSEKGVLRKSVPLWLSSDDVGSLILAYKNPSEALGGAGALYILLRKKIL